MKFLKSGDAFVKQGGAFVRVDETHAGGFNPCGKPCDCEHPCSDCDSFRGTITVSGFGTASPLDCAYFSVINGTWNITTFQAVGCICQWSGSRTVSGASMTASISWVPSGCSFNFGAGIGTVTGPAWVAMIHSFGFDYTGEQWWHIDTSNSFSCESGNISGSITGMQGTGGSPCGDQQNLHQSSIGFSVA